MKHEPMTVREADEYLDEMIHQGSQPHECPRYRQARTIIDALVEAHEAYCAWLEDGWPDYTHSVAFKKLRALERGEEATRNGDSK